MAIRTIAIIGGRYFAFQDFWLGFTFVDFPLPRFLPSNPHNVDSDTPPIHAPSRSTPPHRDSCHDSSSTPETSEIRISDTVAARVAAADCSAPAAASTYVSEPDSSSFSLDKDDLLAEHGDSDDADISSSLDTSISCSTEFDQPPLGLSDSDSSQQKEQVCRFVGLGISGLMNKDGSGPFTGLGVLSFRPFSWRHYGPPTSELGPAVAPLVEQQKKALHTKTLSRSLPLEAIPEHEQNAFWDPEAFLGPDTTPRARSPRAGRPPKTSLNALCPHPRRNYRNPNRARPPALRNFAAPTIASELKKKIKPSNPNVNARVVAGTALKGQHCSRSRMPGPPPLLPNTPHIFMEMERMRKARQVFASTPIKGKNVERAAKFRTGAFIRVGRRDVDANKGVGDLKAVNGHSGLVPI